MKTPLIKHLILLILPLMAACESYEPIKVDPNFYTSLEKTGKQETFVNTPFYVYPTGSGEFLTLYSGVPGKDGDLSRVYGETGAVGTSLGVVDSVEVKYAQPGIYKLTLVSSSVGKYGKEYETDSKTIEITVHDNRNSFTSFSFVDNNGISHTGKIENENITLEALTGTDLTNLKPTFTLNSPQAKTFVNGVEQVSGQTAQNLTNPVEYTVRSAYGTERIYTVKVNLIVASSQKSLLKFNLAPKAAGYTGSSGEIGVIDEANKTVTLQLNPGTDPTRNNVWIQMESSPFSKIYIVYGGRDILYSSLQTQRYTLNYCKTIKVVAQDGSSAIYTVIF